VRAAPGCCIVSRYGQSARKSHTRLLRNDDLDAVAGGRPHDLPLGTNENVHYFGFVLPDRAFDLFPLADPV
jgi:hypothetical protein